MLLKGYDARGFVFYTNYESRKGRDLAGNPSAALQFHWVELERVVRIEGQVTKTDAGDSDAVRRLRRLHWGGMLVNAILLFAIVGSIPYIAGAQA